MLRWIVGSSLKGRFLVLALAGALLFFGSLQLKKAPVDVFPEFAPPRVEVQTLCVGLNATEVESLVTVRGWTSCWLIRMVASRTTRPRTWHPPNSG